MNNKILIVIAAVFSVCSAPQIPAMERVADGGMNSCYSRVLGDTLVIGNDMIERKFLWNKGNLMTVSLVDKNTGRVFLNKYLSPDFVVNDYKGDAENADCLVENIEKTLISPAYQKTTVTFSLGELSVKRVFRVYPSSPVIACDTFLKGKIDGLQPGKEENFADRKNIEFAEDMKARPVTSVLDQMNLSGNHWHAKAVEFWDVTDWNNNLVAERDIISYRKNPYRGNLLFVRDGTDGNGFFFLKEAPCSSTQLAYGGADFFADFGKFSVTGIGVRSNDISRSDWTRLYSCVVGVYGEGELSALKALRLYQKNIRRHIPERDDMIMMNTWGDRSQDSKVNETFCLEELDLAARLGITHFQIDDGWQSGKSPNSKLAKGSFKNIWDNPDYWTPDPMKYPHGLAPIVEKGKALGIRICLWFNPSVQNDFADWEKDADAIIRLYRQYGITVFKIDGLTVATKQAEVNLRRLFDKVLAETGDNVMFNLDATASRRGGYHMFNEYGNIFLENRYTDWGNYYPYITLRNLWQLSRYVPAEKIQTEFLNKWRNLDKYKDDPFSPANYSFDYLFAITMAGQPLAWMEASNLPEEAFSIRELVGKYHDMQSEFHEGIVLPVGNEPSGRSWTGFQSVLNDTEGYILVFREDNQSSCSELDTWLPYGKRVTFTPLFGDGKAFSARAGINGSVRFRLDEPNSFAMYRYIIR